MIKNLKQIRENSVIFVDTNIFIYNFDRISKESREFWRLLASGEIRGMTSLVVVQELTHLIMKKELFKKYGKILKSKYQKIIKDPNVLKELTMHQQIVKEIYKLGIPLLPFGNIEYQNALKLQAQYGFLMSDAINLALMKEYEIKNIATHDKDYEKVSWINVYGPKDV